METGQQAAVIDTVLANAQPLQYARADRLPLYVWALVGVGTDDDDPARQRLRQLDERGIAVLSAWDHTDRSESLAQGLRVAALQGELGLPVNVNANRLLHRFCNGDPRTAHVTDAGEPFFDRSFAPDVAMGCPLRLRFRYPEIAARVLSFARAYQEAGCQVDFIFADWEIDGAIEWNGAWESARNCRHCRTHIPDVDDFRAFQRAVRELRSEMQRETFVRPLQSIFPDATIGNYAVYPHDGYRYWYDYFETYVDGAPHRVDGRARYRAWYPEFPLTGYTCAMPVVYTWYPTYHWYDLPNPDYRWFYNMLLVASNAGAHTPVGVPIIPFVHWHTTSPPPTPDPAVRQFSERGYQELLWHMLLRGADTFFLWCVPRELAHEVRLLHQVYADALRYAEFLNRGEPVTFDVPKTEGAVLSALRLGDRLLVRRTDFVDHPEPVSLSIGDRAIDVPRQEGECRILTLPSHLRAGDDDR
jgi:hypothetical protein